MGRLLQDRGQQVAVLHFMLRIKRSGKRAGHDQFDTQSRFLTIGESLLSERLEETDSVVGK